MISLFPERGAPVLFEAELDSTNTRLKAMAAYAEPGTVIAAGRQTGGRGRLGRSFASPSGGVYLSMLLAPAADMRACLTLTPTAAVAVRRALKKVCGLGADIKWPNDLQFGGKKLCGILGVELWRVPLSLGYPALTVFLPLYGQGILQSGR